MVSEKRGRDEGKVYLCNFSLYHMRKDRQSASMKERKRKKEENQRNGIREKEGRKEKKDQGMMSQGKKKSRHISPFFNTAVARKKRHSLIKKQSSEYTPECGKKTSTLMGGRDGR